MNEALHTDAPFDFSCQRSGRCCTQGEGQVWLEEGEEERLARSLGISTSTFLQRFTEIVEGRRTLRSEQGRCVLLEGRNECTVYVDRPAQCARFPFWPEILGGGDALAWAAETCPGIRLRVARAAREDAFERLRELYRRLDEDVAAANPVCDLRGTCCDFERTDHVLFASRLETDFAAAAGAETTSQAALPPGERTLCPFWKAGRCTNRAGRPLGCRVYFCDTAYAGKGEALYERYYAAIKKICSETGYPFSYSKFISSLPRTVSGNS